MNAEQIFTRLIKSTGLFRGCTPSVIRGYVNNTTVAELCRDLQGIENFELQAVTVGKSGAMFYRRKGK